MGHGGFATVWLCLVVGEVPQYAALKILMADCSGDYCPELRGLNAIQDSQLVEDGDSRLLYLPLDQFRFEGPNGSHLCFVYPVAGPQASRIPPVFSDPDRMLRRVPL